MAPHAYQSAHSPSAAEGFRTHIQAEEEEEEEEEGAEILFLMFLTLVSWCSRCSHSELWTLFPCLVFGSTVDTFSYVFWWLLVRPLAPCSHLFGVGCCSGVQGLWFSGR